MKLRLSSIYVAVSVVLLCAATLLGPDALGLTYLISGTLVVITTAVGIRLHRPGTRSPWWWLAAGSGAFVLGEVLRAVHGGLVGVERPFPSPADTISVGAYLCVILGVRSLLQSRSRRADLTTTLDAWLLAGGVGTLTWVYLMGPYVADPSIPGDERLLNSLYSMMDIVVVAMIARVALTPGHRPRAYYLLATAGAMVLAANVLATMASAGLIEGDVFILPASLAFFLMGATVLHPTMGKVTDRTAAPLLRLTRRRLVAIAAAVLLPPLLLVIEDLRSATLQLPVVVTAWIVLTVVGLGRLGELVWSKQRLVQRQATLLEVGQELVSVTSTHEIHQIALDGVVRLTKAAPGHQAASVVTSPVPAGEWSEELLEGGAANLVVLNDVQAPDMTDGEMAEWLVVAPLMGSEGLLGAIFVTSTAPPEELLLEGLRSLATDLALALSAAELGEQMHLQRSARRFEALAAHSSDLVLVLDEQLDISFASPSAQSVLGLDSRGINIESSLHDEDMGLLGHLIATASSGSGSVGPSEVRFLDSGGRSMWCEVVVTDLRNEPEVGGIVVNAHDVTGRKQLEESLRHQALHDSLTGLANRFLFQQRVTHALVRRATLQDVVCVMFIDLDDFKTVNDSLGHAAGDNLLQLVARRISGAVHSADTPARLGGDEFAVLLETAQTKTEAVQSAERLLTALGQPFVVEGRLIEVTASVGIVFADAQSSEAEILLRNADVAMYAAKSGGKGGYRVFEQEMHASVFERMELRSDLNQAMNRGELWLAYQPIVDLRTQRLAGFEALMRWTHPQRGPIPPTVFIPIAEETGLIDELGKWLVEEAVGQVAHWQNAFDNAEGLFMSINASVEQLHTAEFSKHVADVLARNKVPATCLTVEVTETVLAEDLQNVSEQLYELKSQGIELAIDDFGTGYSSLGYLQAMPFDKLKVDKSFVDLLIAGEDDRVVLSILEMAQRLELPVVAEGIEHAEQAARLTALNCEYGQGYHFARPMTADQATDMLGRTNASRFHVDDETALLVN